MFDEVKVVLVDLFKHYFSVDTINTDINFFDMGITSVELLGICNELSKRLNKEINIIMLYEYPTISLLSKELAEMIEA
jgi:acyl carrier protein